MTPRGGEGGGRWGGCCYADRYHNKLKHEAGIRAGASRRLRRGGVS
jgi:hypothetical protein